MLTDEDWPAVLEVDGNAFGSTFEAEVIESPSASCTSRAVRSGAFDGSTLVGLTSAFSFDLTVPGAVVPAAGVSWVGVLPTHRRRGVLRGLMTTQLNDVHERGREAVAILWASEPVIYGRFGYGLASSAYSVKVPRNAQALRADAPSDPALRLRLVPAEDWKLTADVYAAAAARPTRHDRARRAVAPARCQRLPVAARGPLGPAVRRGRGRQRRPRLRPLQHQAGLEHPCPVGHGARP